MSREGEEWILRDKSENELGRFDWLCVTSHTLGHTRWEKVFGFPPPLKTTSGKVPELGGVVEALEDVVSQPVFVAMVAFKRDVDQPPLLPYAITHVQNHPTISRIVHQVSGGFASVVVHSTSEFAAAHVDVYGSKSAAASLAGGEKWKSEENQRREAQLLEELYRDTTELMARLHVDLPKEASFGPVLHRWGSAFCSASPNIEAAIASAEEHRVLLCGDFTAPLCPSLPYTAVEHAAVSGMEAAGRLLSKL